VQFDGEKLDKITRGCNDDKVIFENTLKLDNPEFYFREAGGVRTWASHSGAQWRTIVRVAFRGYVGRIQHENGPFSTVVESWRGHFYE
jgi:hypothetical protein